MATLFTKISKKMEIGRNLPPSYHKLPGEKYDIKKSEIVQWLIQQPEILQFLWDQFQPSGYIIYDRSTGKWHGVDYDKDKFS